MTMSRRDSLKWMAAAAALAAGARGQAFAQPVTPPPSVVIPVLSEIAPWPVVALPPVTAPGYGTDPDTQNPSAPWPLTLTPAQRATVNALGDILLPPDDQTKGAGEADIAAFFDEWVSAPYADQQADRLAFVLLFDWCDAQSQLMTGRDFAAAPPIDRTRVVDALLAPAVPYALQSVATAFARFRVAAIFGFYTVPDHAVALGLWANEPVMGDYPGPTPDAMDHLNALLVSLKLEPYS